MAKKSVVQFTAQWMPDAKQPENPQLTLAGMVQVVGDKPTELPAHVVLREVNDGRLGAYPGVTMPKSKQISFGSENDVEGLYGCDLHQVKLAKGSVVTVRPPGAAVTRYKIERVEPLND